MRFFYLFLVVFFSINTSIATVRYFDVSTLESNVHPEYPSNESPLKRNWWDTIIFHRLEPNTEYEFDVYAYDSEESRNKRQARDQSEIYAVISTIKVDRRDASYQELLEIEARGTKIKFKTHPARKHKNGLSIGVRIVNLSYESRYLGIESEN